MKNVNTLQLVRFKILSKLIFASCVWYCDPAYYGVFPRWAFFFIISLTLLLSSFWTSRGHRCRLFSLPVLASSIFVAHRVQQSHCSSIFHGVLLTYALALSASQFVHKKKSQRIYPSMHSATQRLELTKLTYTRFEDNLIRHRGDRLKDLSCRLSLELSRIPCTRVIRVMLINPYAETIKSDFEGDKWKCRQLCGKKCISWSSASFISEYQWGEGGFFLGRGGLGLDKIYIFLYNPCWGHTTWNTRDRSIPYSLQIWVSTSSEFSISQLNGVKWVSRCHF